MQITITTREGLFAKILRKFTLIFFGIFLTSFIFALSTRFTGRYGVWLGLLICGILIFIGFYYVEKGSRLRVVAWSMLITIIVFAIVFVAGITVVSNALQGL